MIDTFDIFDADTIAAIEAAQQVEQIERKRARAVKKSNRYEMRRATAEKHLQDILPARVEPSESWHVISHGDIDSLSYLAHAIKGVPHFDRVLLSTWCMASPDLDQLSSWLDCGRIDRLEIYVGEIFPNQYIDAYQKLKQMQADYEVRICIARNHSKVMLASHEDSDYYWVSESSANVNTNPRIEQTALHNSRALFDFYAEFFAGLKTIEKSCQSA